MSRYNRLSVVVLGSGGFVGRHVCDAFAATDARVLGVVRSAPEHTEHKEHRGPTEPGGRTEHTGRRPALPVVRLDLSTAPQGRVAEVLREAAADVVVNAAGAVWQATDDQLVQSNVELTRRLIAAMTSLERRPRLIHLGSVQEYGAGVPGTALTEDQPPRPVNPYGRSKLLATEAVLRATEEELLDGVVLRIANVCGPHAPRGSLLGMIAAHLAAVARQGTASGPSEASGLRLSPLRARRDFVDVRDVADAVVAAARTGLDRAATSERIINIGCGEAVSVRQIVGRLIALSGLDTSVIEEQDAPSGRTGVEWQQVDIARARKLLDWQPRRTLEQSLRDLLATAE
ncbi:NAD(P)-dependent oxidoreductase [Streptomyces sp. NPDC013178]|uniref:NAD-dependent epimerase/dehydratase family protein n=1 Tax=Streptomyces sp. NPDC013178 TaxID=3155118 RepID=UPI0033F7D711